MMRHERHHDFAIIEAGLAFEVFEQISTMHSSVGVDDHEPLRVATGRQGVVDGGFVRSESLHGGAQLIGDLIGVEIGGGKDGSGGRG